MELIPIFNKELDYEAEVTRKMLSRVPEDKFDWKPHEKSMSMKVLAGHIAELPSWIAMGLQTDEMDFEANPYQPPALSSSQDLLELFEKSLREGRAALANASEADMLPTWTLRAGAQVYMQLQKHEVIRHSLNQITHHRAQLGVYLRLLNIPIPGSYGPSADEADM